MASDEPTNSPAPILPQYPELILAAIEALDDKNRVNKSTISKHIEDTYGNLPAAHTTLLSHHLNKMKASGQLVMLKNNYLKPDPNAPPRRGRGRPPKPKDPNAPAAPVAVASPSGRGRGRPPKPKDPNAPAAPVAVASPSGRGRGRPPKARDPLAPVPTTPTKTKPPPSGRKPGRPPKAGKSNAAVTPLVVPLTASGAPRGRGRPPKVKAPVAASVGA